MGGLWRGFWQGSQPCPGRQKDPVAKGTASFALRGGWAPPDEDPLDQNSVGGWGGDEEEDGGMEETEMAFTSGTFLSPRFLMGKGLPYGFLQG